MKQSTPIKAAFFDIDGTLRSHETGCVSSQTIQALRQLREKEIKVIVSTGRQPFTIPDMGIFFDGFITANGSFCFTDDKIVLRECFLPETELYALIELAQVQKFAFSISTKKAECFNLITDVVLGIQKSAGLTKIPLGNMTDLISQGVSHVIIYEPKSVVENILKQAMPSCYASGWTSLFCDVNLVGTDKQIGMKRFLEHYGIDVSETIAFGDGHNDISMLQYAGIGVAMGNASTMVKQSADYVTDTADNDGISKALIKLGLL